MLAVALLRGSATNFLKLDWCQRRALFKNPGNIGGKRPGCACIFTAVTGKYWCLIEDAMGAKLAPMAVSIISGCDTRS